MSTKYEITWTGTVELDDQALPVDAARAALRLLRSSKPPAYTFTVREAQRHAHGKAIVLQNSPENTADSPEELMQVAMRDERLREMLLACYHALTPIVEKGAKQG